MTDTYIFRFVTDVLKDLSESYQEYQKQYEEQQSAVVIEIIRVAAGYCDSMVRLSTIIAKLDVLVSFAQVSTLQHFQGLFIVAVILIRSW